MTGVVQYEAIIELHSHFRSKQITDFIHQVSINNTELIVIYIVLYHHCEQINEYLSGSGDPTNDVSFFLVAIPNQEIKWVSLINYILCILQGSSYRVEERCCTALCNAISFDVVKGMQLNLRYGLGFVSAPLC